ncbi:Uma2 family endonuclease [Spirillospora sp. NPDC029432]|uniref:Uma2 family endonuclease n=1 Tax=Spirillospora sp. NPDC029432 TaxID=3154599 RepID=UPI0034531685
MTAEATHDLNTVPDWLRPPPEGFRAEDLDHMPYLPPHAELIDGGIVLASRQNGFHSLAKDVLASGLRRTVPEHLAVRRDMTVTLAERQRPEPDVMVVHAEAVRGLEQNGFRARDVVLVIEVVMPASEIRDRERKPQLYAQAGIPFFWRVEPVNGVVQVSVHERDPISGRYSLTGSQRGRLTLGVPFGVDIDLTEIERL